MSQSQPPFRVGTVISAGFRLYRDNFKAYFGLSLIANLWLLVPFFSLIFIIILGFLFWRAFIDSNQNEINFYFIIFCLFSVGLWIVLTVFSSAKSLTNTALISRLAFNLLMNQPESVSQARQELTSKIGLFWVTQFLTNLLLVLISWGWQIFQLIFFNLPASLLENQQFKQIIVFIGNLVYFIGYSWFYARLFIPEVPLAIENNLKSGEAINRSWTLTQNFAWKIIFIIFLSILITLPVYLLSGIPLIFASIYTIKNLLNQVPYWLIVPIISYAILGSILIFILLNVAILPFWQTLKSVIYYDLRSRRGEIESVGQDYENSL